MRCSGNSRRKRPTTMASERLSVSVTRSTSPLYMIFCGRLCSVSSTAPASRAAAMATSRNWFIGLLRHSGGEIFLAITHGVSGVHADHYVAVASRWRRGIGIVAEQILGAQLAIDAIKDFAQLAEVGRVVHRAADAVRDGGDGMLARGVPSGVGFHRAHDYSIEQNVGGDRGAARVFEF